MTETVAIETEFPVSWAHAELQDCVQILDSKRIPINNKERQERISGKAESDLFPYYGATGQIGWIDDYIFDQEILLLGEDGVPFLDSNKSKAYLVGGKTWVNNHAHVLDAIQNVASNKFVLHFLNQFDFHGYVTGTTRLKLNQARMREIPVPLPPLNEQHRIVEKIEELFTKLDAGVRSLKQAREQLKSYRRSVLKAAVEGELSREWREAHRDELEPASELLGRILQERREKFTGKKYKEPASPDTSELTTLPDGWVWSSLEQLSWDSGYGTSSKCGYDFTGPPVLRIPNISRAKVSLEDIKFADPEAKLKHEGRLDAGDLLIIRTNGSRDLIGRGAVVKQSFENDYFFASYLIRYRLAGNNPLYRWIETIWHSHSIRSWMHETAATSAGQYNVSVSALNRLTTPLPPQDEIQQIAEKVERRLSVVDKLEATVEENLKQAVGLRQSILKQAFSGELVPQDPDDEPASVLLERIKEEQHAKKQKVGKRRQRKVAEDGEGTVSLFS